MGSTFLGAMEKAVRSDLKDLDSSNYLWTTIEIDRHIQHAVNDYQRIVPVIAHSDLVVATSVSTGPVTPITSRQVLTPPVGYLWALRVEYPIDGNPPTYLMFREEIPGGGSLYFPIATPPVVGQNLRVWYAAQHTLTMTASTILQEHEEVILLGATSYAAQAVTRYSDSRAAGLQAHGMSGAATVATGIQAFATERMAAYTSWLAQLRKDYPGAASPFQQWGQVPSDSARV